MTINAGHKTSLYSHDIILVLLLVTSLYSYDNILVLFQWLIKQDYEEK